MSFLRGWIAPNRAIHSLAPYSPARSETIAVGLMPTRAPLTLSVNQAICMIDPREAAMMIASTSSGEPLTS
jgi:hypothetical protein